MAVNPHYRAERHKQSPLGEKIYFTQFRIVDHELEMRYSLSKTHATWTDWVAQSVAIPRITFDAAGHRVHVGASGGA